MAEKLSDKTQKISRTAAQAGSKKKKASKFASLFPHRVDVDREISRTRLVIERKMEEGPGKLHADMAELHPQLPDKGSFYEEGKILGEGGQGIVFRATDKSLERIVAVKSLRKELLEDPKARKSFITEAKITAQLEHPSIVPIYSLTGDSEGGLHLSMKMLRGMTLATYLDETCRRYRENGIRCYDEAKALRYRLELFLRVCDALSYVHSRNLMHRDLKPGNIILGEYHEVYLIDWGIATAIRSEHPGAPTSTFGTPPFMAPEVIAGEAGDQRSDIFALGVILFDVVFLKSAFPGKTPEELVARVQNDDHTSFRHAFHAGVSRELAAIVRKAIAHSPRDRYQSTDELSRDLRNYLANAETTALPDGFFGKISRAMAHHRRLVAASTALIIFAFLGHIAWNFYQQRNTVIAQQKYERVLSELADNTAFAAYQIEQKFGNLETLMKEFSAEITARLEFPPAADAPKPVEFLPQYQSKRPADAHFSPYYQHWLKIDHGAMRLADKEVDSARAGKEIAQLAPAMEKLIPRFLQIGSLLPDDRKTLPVLKEEMLQSGNMMLWFYFASPAGFLLQYPASDALPDIYDPRDRNWYIQGKAHLDTQVHWSKPYLGLQVKKMMMTCTQACRIDGALRGVSGLDVTLERFREVMMQYGADAKWIDARILLDSDGNILVSADGDGKPIWENDSGKVTNIYHTVYADLYRKAAKKGFGDAIEKTPEGRKLLLFFPVHKMNWCYAEVIDLERALVQ